jgi:hypothetical protein
MEELSNLTFAEPIDLNLVRYLYNVINSSAGYTPDELANLNIQLKTIMKSISRNNYNIVNYSHSKNMGIGRVYASKNNAVASVKKIVRNTIVGDNFIDIDEDKSYATHTYNLALHLGYNPTQMVNILSYITDNDNKIRNDIAKYYEIEVKNAKMILNAVLFGKTLKNALTMNVAKSKPIYPFVNAFVNEIENVKQFLCSHNNYTHLKNDIYKKYIKTDWDKVSKKDRITYKTLELYNQNKPINTLLSYILQHQEYLSLEAKLKALVEMNAIDVIKIKIKGNGNKCVDAYLCSLAHDGVMLVKKKDFVYDKQFINQLAYNVKCKLNYSIYNLSIKPTTERIDINYDDFEDFKSKTDDDVGLKHFIRHKITDATAGEIIKTSLKDKLVYDDNIETWYFYDNGYFKTINKGDVSSLILSLFGENCSYGDALFTLEGHYFNTDKSSKIINFIKEGLKYTDFYKDHLSSSKGYILFKDKIIQSTATGIKLLDHTPNIKFFVKPIDLDATLIYNILNNELGTYVKEKDISFINDILKYETYVDKTIFKDPYDDDAYGNALKNYIIRSLFGLFIGDKDKIFLTMRGGANSSKGVITNWVNKCFGSLIGELNGEVLCAKLNKEADDAKALAPFASLLSCRLIIINEISKSSKYNTVLIKKISSGGDTIQVRALFKNQVSVSVCFKLLLFMNEWIVAEDNDDALIVRNKAIEMNYTFGAVENLDKKIKKGDAEIKNICETDIKYRYAFVLALMRCLTYTHSWNDIVEETSKRLTTKNLDDKLQIVERIMCDSKENNQYILCKFNNIDVDVNNYGNHFITTDEMRDIYDRLPRAYPKKHYEMGFKLKRDFIEYLEKNCGVVKIRCNEGKYRNKWLYVGIDKIINDDEDEDEDNKNDENDITEYN